MLISFYNYHNKTMRTSGVNDPSASLFRVKWFSGLVMYLAKAYPYSFRFIATDDGTIIHAPSIPSVESITVDRLGGTLRPDFVQKMTEQNRWKLVTPLYFWKNHNA